MFQAPGSKRQRKKVSTYAVIDYILAPRIVVDVDRNAAQRGDFGGKFREAGVVLSLCSDRDLAWNEKRERRAERTRGMGTGMGKGAR